MKCLAYPKYKDANTGFIASLPAHWISKRLKYMGNLQTSNVDKKSVEGQEEVCLCNYMDVYKNERITPDIGFMEATATKAQVERFGLRRGDVLLTKDSETPDDIAVPAVVLEDMEDVLCGYHLAMVRPQGENEGRYLARAISARGLREQFYVEALGVTRFGLDYNAIGSAQLPAPPPDEQRKIADFLDRETEKIDSLIAEKEKLIRLLEEKRKAVISEAVTKGLNPDAKMRDSGVPWLGRIPAHWKVVTIRRITESHKQGYYTTEAYTSEGTKLARITDIDDFGRINFNTMPCVDADSQTLESFRVVAGDFLFARSGTIGRFGVAENPPDSVFASYLIRFRFRFCSPQYLKLFYMSTVFKQALIGDLHGGANKNIHAENIKNIWLAYPPEPAEQRQIASVVSKQTDALTSTITTIESAIGLLHERRAALITAAVTGKIDIRKGAGCEA